MYCTSHASITTASSVSPPSPPVPPELPVALHPPSPAYARPLQESKRKAVSMLFRAAMLCHDEVRLQTVAPHLLALITQSEAKRGKAAGGAAEKLPAGVRALALRCLVRLVASVAVIPPSDAKVG